jgi:nickel-dependent lactate racemase
VKAHAAGVDFLRTSSLEYLPRYADAVITSAAGYPLDLTFYQTIKGITAVQHIVKPGGKILIMSECAEGVGSSEFARMLKSFRAPQAYLDEIADTPVVPDQWQLERLALVALKHPILFYTPGIVKDDLGALGQQSFLTAKDAVANLIVNLPSNATIAVVPDGPYAYARVQAAK